MTESDFEYFDQQVAGHDRLTANDLMVIKPCRARELVFYQTAQAHYPDFLDFLPQCYGTLRATTQTDLQLLNTELDKVLIDPQAEENVCLENVLNGFTQPCIMDLKLGSLLYHAEATAEKIERMKQQSANTTSSELGLRICGMKIYDPTRSRLVTFDKQLGKSLTAETIQDAFDLYLCPARYPDHPLGESKAKENTVQGHMEPRHLDYILECFVDTLNEIRQALIDLPQLSLIGSSLLFVYEGDPTAAKITWKKLIEQDRQEEKKQDTTEEEEEIPKMCDLRLIDFAHSDWHMKRDQQDLDLIKGIDNTLAILSSLGLKRQQ
ncbi:inositol polyphosphate kinase-domain-containing protein [Sporodiniella umbellata]|nr:inositol polyphosphate kinase-domain-containing protein [Sporodiniella umbellata]